MKIEPARRISCVQFHFSFSLKMSVRDGTLMHRVWRAYLLLGCKCFSFVIIYHATRLSLLKQPIAKMANRQIHWVERLMPFVDCMSVQYRKGFAYEADPVSRRPDFPHPDDVHMRMSVAMSVFRWDGKAHNMC